VSDAAGAVERSGFVAVAGRPNAGKSTLVNRLVGEHVAIVSPIAQTTRRLARGVLTTGNSQLVFVDLPGSQKPVDRLTERMQSSVERALTDVDLVLWVVDGMVAVGKGERAVGELVFAAGVPVVIALNKVDRTKPDVVAQRIHELMEIVGEREYHALVPVSAVTGDGCPELLGELVDSLPPGMAWYPADERTDMRTDERLAEFVREAALHHLREELPHATIAEVVDLSEREDGALDVDAVIWVENESQVGIVVGKAGSMIKTIGTEARTAAEAALERRIHLNLRVKVRRKWRDDDAWLARAGL
jgi:GTPase